MNKTIPPVYHSIEFHSQGSNLGEKTDSINYLAKLLKFLPLNLNSLELYLDYFNLGSNCKNCLTISESFKYFRYLKNLKSI